MEDQENNEIKILIDALKYTSNIIVDLTNKLTVQEEKINILENKLNKIQKISLDNNFKLKTIDFDKLNEILKSYEHCRDHKNNNGNFDISDEISEYVIEKNINNKTNKINNNDFHTNNPINLSNKNNIQSNILVEEPKDKNKIDKLIGSIVKRKNLLNQMINDNKEKNVLTGYDNIQDKKQSINYHSPDLTIKTGTNKSEIIDIKSYPENTAGNEIDYDNIINAQNNDLNKANNILKQIRRRGNFVRKI